MYVLFRYQLASFFRIIFPSTCQRPPKSVFFLPVLQSLNIQSQYCCKTVLQNIYKNFQLQRSKHPSESVRLYVDSILYIPKKTCFISDIRWGVMFYNELSSFEASIVRAFYYGFHKYIILCFLEKEFKRVYYIILALNICLQISIGLNRRNKLQYRRNIDKIFRPTLKIFLSPYNYIIPLPVAKLWLLSSGTSNYMQRGRMAVQNVRNSQATHSPFQTCP